MTEPKQSLGGFTSLQVSRITGATLRQLQWWDEKNILRPKFLRGIRIYSLDQVEMIELIVKMRKAGVSLQNLRGLASSQGAKQCKRIVVAKQSAVIVGDTLVVFQGRTR